MFRSHQFKLSLVNSSIRLLSLSFSVWVCALWAGVVLAADAIPGEEYCDRPVSSIVFAGNRVTKPQVLLREMAQRMDAACSIDKIVDSTQSVMDLGLFKSVVADLAIIDAKLQLRLTVKEKLYFLAIPRVSRTSDAELRGGLQLRFDNFLGRLHEMRITSERRKEDDGNGPGGFVHRLSYDIPRFFGSKYGFGLELGTDRRQLSLSLDGNEFGVAQSQTQTVGVQFSRWLNQSEGVQGRRYFFGARFSQRDFDLLSGSAGPFMGGDDFSFVLGMENKQIRQELYRRTGNLIGGQITVARNNARSDFEYTRVDIYANTYIPLANGIRNINVRARLGVSDGAAFGENSYSIGGGEDLRGMKSGSIDGDVITLLNVEYLQAWYDYPQWRWVAFADIGNVYKRKKVNLFELRARGGLGIRRKLLSLSNTDIRFDVAWDPSREKLQTYVSSNMTF